MHYMQQWPLKFSAPRVHLQNFGAGGVIALNATLVFNVEMLAVK